MKRSLLSFRLIFALALAAVLLLAACERQLEEGGSAPESATATPAFGVTLPAAPLATAPGYPGPGVGGQPTASPPAAGGGAQVTYQVQAGDTLELIAQRYGLTVEQLALANSLVVGTPLTAGQTLIIPTAAVVPTAPPIAQATPTTGPAGEIIHIVQAGENLYRIGLQYGIPYQEIAAYNGIVNPDFLEVGQEIRIPPQGN